MRLRGLRTISLACGCFYIGIISLSIVITYIISIVHTFIIYNNFIDTYQFSKVPFWQDERILNKKQLLPVMKIENVNLSNSTIVIAACCRNVETFLVDFRKNVKLITNLFGKYRIYLGESDSHDKTLTLLNQWQINDSEHVRILTKGQQRWKSFSRTARIASCRNSLLQKAREEFSSFDYYFVVDVDVGSSYSFEVKDFLSNFIYPPSSWIAMTATQRSEYYDIWALRISPILQFDCWLFINQLTSIYIDQSLLTDRLVKIHQKSIPRNVSLIEVESAFGGAALYNGKYLNMQCSYDGTNENEWWWNDGQCEHVSFHQCLRNFAQQQKIYINPQFQIC